MGGRHDRQKKFFHFLQAHDGKAVKLADICNATGWKPSGAKTYLSKKVLGGLVVRQEDKRYLIQGAASLSEGQFLRLLSQSKERQRFGHQFPPLSQQLLERSRTNVGLAVETFNRATLDNRLDAFVLLFITGWEQLLKAELEDDEAGSIFTGDKSSTGRDKTIGFQQCLDRLMKPSNVVRKNLEVIRSLRDDAAHLLVSELQPVATRYFQAGLTNYVERFHAFTGENPLSLVGAGLLTLALPYMRPDVVALRSKYGDGTAREVSALVETLEEAAHAARDRCFAIEIRYRLVLTDEPGAGTIQLTKGSSPDATQGFIVEKAVDAERRYCFFETELRQELSRRTGRGWSQSDIRCVVFKEKVKNSNNKHHHHFRKTNRHAYSPEFVDLVVDRLTKDGTYLDRAREAWLHDLRKRRRSKKV